MACAVRDVSSNGENRRSKITLQYTVHKDDLVILYIFMKLQTNEIVLNGGDKREEWNLALLIFQLNQD